MAPGLFVHPGQQIWTRACPWLRPICIQRIKAFAQFQVCGQCADQAAIALLAQHPITISEAMAAELDNAIHGGYLRKYVIPAFEKASSVSFESLPKQAQAVIMSVCFQKGCGGVRRDWPKLWGYLTACNWPAAAEELRTGFSEYTVRRRREGALLAELC